MASRFCYGRLISICFITTLLGFIFQLWPIFTSSSQLPAKFNASRMPTVSLQIGIKQYSSSTKLTYDADFVIRRCQLNLVVNRWMQQGWLLLNIFHHHRHYKIKLFFSNPRPLTFENQFRK